MTYDIDEASILAVWQRGDGATILQRREDRNWQMKTSLTVDQVHALKRRALAQPKHALCWFTGSMTVVSS